MTRLISKNKKWFGYFIYAMVVGGLLLYYRFPSRDLAGYLAKRVNELAAGFSFKVERLIPTLPPGLELINSELALAASPGEPYFKAERFYIGPAVWPLLQGVLSYDFRCTAYNGEINGRLHRHNNGPAIETKIEISEVALGDYGRLEDLLGRRLQGALSGTISYSGSLNAIISGQGEAALSLTKGAVEIFQPLFGVDSLDLQEVTVNAVLEKRRLNLSRIEIKGREMQGSFSGSIRLEKNYLQSRLDLSGTIEPYADFFKGNQLRRDAMKFLKNSMVDGKLSVAITGTIKEPAFRF